MITFSVCGGSESEWKKARRKAILWYAHSFTHRGKNDNLLRKFSLQPHFLAFFSYIPRGVKDGLEFFPSFPLPGLKYFFVSFVICFRHSFLLLSTWAWAISIIFFIYSLSCSSGGCFNNEVWNNNLNDNIICYTRVYAKKSLHLHTFESFSMAKLTFFMYFCWYFFKRGFDIFIFIKWYFITFWASIFMTLFFTEVVQK